MDSAGSEKDKKRKILGKQGEEIARSFLEGLGYQFQKANFRTRTGEIDLIMLDGGQLVFVEVKTRKTTLYGHGLEAITSHKRQKIRRTAMEYIRQHGAHSGMSARFDVVVITYSGGTQEILHLVSAF
ncbi:YraN family protein [Aneurinibacillus terranovensis]|uniref:YraN family protein n=1 Tax=Aneurinibacillus terranovensis TaxID=278991 RepID=UPI0004259AF9|nr:YraN family protein [Aneurinibacillus terranovensis]